MDRHILAGFAAELEKDAIVKAVSKGWKHLTKPGPTGVVTKVVSPVAQTALLGTAGFVGAGELASRSGHLAKRRYQARLTGSLGRRSHLYGNPASYG